MRKSGSWDEVIDKLGWTFREVHRLSLTSGKFGSYVEVY